MKSAVAFLALLALTACDRPVAPSAPAPKPMPDVTPVAAPARPVGTWARDAARCGAEPWIVTAQGLITPGEVTCHFTQSMEINGGVAVASTCVEEGMVKAYEMRLAASGDTLRIEGAPFGAADLIRCTGAPDMSAYPPVEPIPPGQPGALPNDRAPVSDAPFTAGSPQGAANVVQTYFAAIGEKDYAQAWRQWRDGTFSGFRTQGEFAASFVPYLDYRGLVGAPGDPEGAAGSLYIDVPVQVYGRRVDGRELHLFGKAVLRRVNDVEGSTPGQRQWRIIKLDLRPAPRDGQS